MVEKMNAASSPVDGAGRILDTGIVIDKLLAFFQSWIYSLFSGIFQVFQNIRPHNRFIVPVPFHLTKGGCM